MVRGRRAVLVLLLALARPGAAHIVPVPPSTCAFDPIVLDAPATGVTASAAPATAGDQLTIRYDPQASQAQFDAASTPPRSFSASGASGTLAVPALFTAGMLNSGDLRMPDVPLTVAMGSTTDTLSLSFTTGLAAAGDLVVEGSPIDASGRFTLVGVDGAAALPDPFGNTAVVVSLTCVATPRPDLDQFVLATRTKLLSARLTAKTLRLRAIFAPGPGQAPDFAGRPALFRAHAGAASIAAVHRPDGLARRSRTLFVARSADGRTVVAVALVARQPQTTYLLGVRVASPTLPETATPTPVAFSYDVGGLLSRVTATLRPKRHGTMFQFP